MTLNPIGDPVLTPDMIHDISQAATTLAQVDHFLKHGSVYDRKLAHECREQCRRLEAMIALEHSRRKVRESAREPS